MIRDFGLRASPRTWLLCLATSAIGVLWLTSPLLWPMHAATRTQSAAEAPVVAALLVVGTVLTWISLWLDAGRDFFGLGLVVAATVANVAARQVLNAGTGIEVNFVLPLLAGAAGGAPVGFLVGATSCLLSQFSMDLAGSPLAGQLVVWGIAGLLGGLVHRLTPRMAWLSAVPVALLFGPLAGLGLNLIGWPTAEPSGSGQYFFPGLPPSVNLERLVGYTVATSLGYDLTRGVVTALGVALVGAPLIAALRQAWAPDPSPPVDRPSAGPDPTAVERRRRAREHLAHWTTNPTLPDPEPGGNPDA